jgi:hypothetical protein
VSFVLLCSFAGGVEPFLLPLEELVVSEFCVGAPLWHMYSLLCAFLSFGIAYVT